MAADPNNLIWIDMEMTGLQPDSDRIIEIAMLVTDSQLAVVAEGPALVVHQPDAVLEAMDSWNKSTHKKTGLIERVRASSMSEADAERAALEFLGEHGELRVRDQQRDLDDAVGVRLQAGHLHVDPDEVVGVARHGLF